jgi:hypothetical protein
MEEVVVLADFVSLGELSLLVVVYVIQVEKHFSTADDHHRDPHPLPRNTGIHSCLRSGRWRYDKAKGTLE